MERPQLYVLLQNLQESDIVYVHEISHLSRSTKDLLEVIEQIKEKNADLKSITETWLDTLSENPMNEFLLTVFSGLAQFERSMIKHRQKEGIEIAEAQGKFKGRKVELIEGGKKAHKTLQAIEWYIKCKTLSIGTGTLYRLLEREGLH